MRFNSRSERLNNSCGVRGVRQTLRSKPNGAQGHRRQENPEDKSSVADAIDDERFFPSVGSRLFQEIETDQQVAAKADAFPANKHEEHVVRQNEHQHGEHEEIQLAEEAVVAAFVPLVPEGVRENQEADAGNYEKQDAEELVEMVTIDR